MSQLLLFHETNKLARQESIDWLTKHGHPCLPVAPAQDPEKYPARDKDGNIKFDKHEKPLPAFTGKNPSYLDAEGNPHLVKHTQYQERLPNLEELRIWFENPANGLGRLCGWDRTIDLDFDTSKFDSQEDCDQAVAQWLDNNPQLRNTFQERTQSGGYRFTVKCHETPEFTNFALELGGKHRGEALGKGRFTVLAPTIGPSGNPYVNLKRVEPIEVDSLESIGIYPVSSKAQKQHKTGPTLHLKQVTTNVPGAISLADLGTDESRRVLNGEDIKSDRSESLTTALHEWHGWQNWAYANSFPITGTPEELAYEAGSKLGIDDDRVGRILKSINSSTCQPACIYSGDEHAAWRKIARLNPVVFERVCPQDVKVRLVSEYANNDSAQNANDTDEDSIKSSATPLSKAEQLKLEIIACLNLSDIAKSAVEKARICSYYGINKGDFEHISCQIQAGKETSRKPQMLTLREASLITTPNVEYLVDGWLPRYDSVVCSGLPGTGKTLITADLAFAVSTGGVFLGAQARKGKVLVLNSDQQLDITVSYLQERGCDFEDDSIRVVGSSQKSDGWTVLDLALLKDFLEEIKPDLVLIDSIRSTIVFPLGLEEKSEMIGRYIRDVNSLVLRHASVIWVHHDAKDEGRRGVTKSSGSTAIIGCNSFHWGLELVSENPTDPRRKLSVHKTRRIPPQAVEINLDPTQGFELIGPILTSSKPQQRQPKLRDQILLIFQSHPEKWIKSSEIREIVNSESAYTTLNRLTEEGTLARQTVGHGRGTEYRLSSPED